MPEDRGAITAMATAPPPVSAWQDNVAEEFVGEGRYAWLWGTGAVNRKNQRLYGLTSDLDIRGQLWQRRRSKTRRSS